MKDAFRFLGLAAALGLAAGMVLAGIVLALAAPAYADEGRKADPQAALGVECAWTCVAEKAPAANRLWVLATVVLLAVGMMLLGRDIWAQAKAWAAQTPAVTSRSCAPANEALGGADLLELLEL